MRLEPMRNQITGCFAFLTGLGLFALFSALAPAEAAACMIPEPTPFETSDEEPDEAAEKPDQVEVHVIDVVRGKAPRKEGKLHRVNSCDDIGQLRLGIEGADDEMGYEVEVLDGTLPQNGFEVPDGPVEARDGELIFAWTDGATDDQEAFDFRVEVTAVDPYGQRSEPSEPLRISHAGNLKEDCATPGFYQVPSFQMLGLARMGTARQFMCR